MKKGKFGLYLPLIALFAFLFALLRQPLAVLLIAGFAVVAEQDEWLNRQVVQALFVSFLYSILMLISDACFGMTTTFIDWLAGLKLKGIDFNEILNFFYGFQDTVNALIYIVLLALCILAIINVIRGKDAKIPLLCKIADGDFSKKKKAAKKAPAQKAPAAASAPDFCTKCGAALSDNSAFCPVCGKQLR